MGSSGFLNWWPGDTKDEIIIGAILTQNTNWRNVEKAIHNLRDSNLLSLWELSNAKITNIENAIKPSGFYRQKALRLKNIAYIICEKYNGLGNLFRKDTKELRNTLLSMNGIGMETADSIILYAAEKPSFVIDAYTKRIMSRVYGIDKKVSYETLQSFITSNIRSDIVIYKDFHAQFVELGKHFCMKEPSCSNCPVNKICRYYNNGSDGL